MSQRRKSLLPRWLLVSLSLLAFVVSVCVVASTAEAKPRKRKDKADNDEIFEPEGDDDDEIIGPDGEDDDDDDDIFEPDEHGDDGDEDESDDEEEEEASGSSTILPRGSKRTPPPPGYEKFEVLDRTLGFREDSMFSINVANDGTLWVATYEGRVYRSTDDGETWSEQLVIPQLRSLYGFAGQKILLGSLRSDGATYPMANGMPGGWPVPQLRGDLSGASRAGRNTNMLTPWSTPSAGADALFGPSQAALGGGGGSLGAGLSARAPRLSLLLAILRRPVANLSRARWLNTTTNRNTTVVEVSQDPSDPKRLFAGTGYGLYRSDDGGTSWYRSFAGTTARERWIGHVLPDPADKKHVYMGSSRGLFESFDAGNNWQKNTKSPGLNIRRVVIDPQNSNYIYLAGNGGVFRSSDKGANWRFIYYDSIARRRDVFWMTIDPFDSNIAYLATGDGLMRTTKLRTASTGDWELVNGLRTSNLVISAVHACNKHKGHLYIQTRADLPMINYGANGPESLVLESWDYGQSFRTLAGNRTVGDIRWFTVDPNDNDTVWVAFSRAIVKIERVKGKKRGSTDLSAQRLSFGEPVHPDMPSMSEVIRATLEYQGSEMKMFTDKLDSLRTRNWLPSRFQVQGLYYGRDAGAQVTDIQFQGDRFLNIADQSTWAVSAFMSWTLPDFLQRGDSNPMLRFRTLTMVDSLRGTMLYVMHRTYGELQRIRAKQIAEKKAPLERRVFWELRAQYLETVINLETGDFLENWQKKADK